MNYKELVEIRKADQRDINSIYNLVNFYRFRTEGNRHFGYLLPLSPTEIMKEVQNFFIAEIDGHAIGCASVIEYDGIVELRSLAVDERYQGKGTGSRLVRNCMEEAIGRWYDRIYVWTQTPQVFEKYGFVNGDVPREKLEKDCIKCPLYQNGCVEIPLVAKLSLKSDKD